MTESFIQQEEDDGKIARQSIEVWCSLFEEELAEQASPDVVVKADLIKKYQWQKVACLFLQGLQKTGLDAAQGKDGDDQEWTVSSACQAALNLLAQVVKDDILELTLNYFKQLKAHEESNQGHDQGQWLVRYVGMLVLCSSFLWNRRGVNCFSLFEGYWRRILRLLRLACCLHIYIYTYISTHM